MCGPEERRVEEETLKDHFQRGARKGKLPRAPRRQELSGTVHGGGGGSRPASGSPTAPGPES